MQFKTINNKMKEIYFRVETVENVSEQDNNVWKYLNNMAVLNLSAMNVKIA